MNDTVTLRELIEQRIAELEKRIDERTKLLLATNERDKVTMNERLATMNEFRDQLRQQAATFATREMVDERSDRNRESITKLEHVNAEHDGRIQSLRTVMAIGGFIIVLIQVVIALLKK